MSTIDLKDFEERFATYLTHKVAMRPMAMSDLWPMWLATRNPDFNRHLLWNRPSNVGQLGERLARIGDERRIGRMAANSGVIRATGEWACVLRMYEIEPPPGVKGTAVEGGIWVHPKFWRSGLAVELARLTVDAVFNELDVTLFRACAATQNKASHAMLKASGFVAQRESLVDKEDGSPSPTIEFEVYRDHYKPWFNQAEMQASMLFAEQSLPADPVAA